MLMITGQFPCSATIKSYMIMHTAMSNSDISLAREFQNHLSDPKRAHGLIYHRKDRKLYIKLKWTDREYHVQDRKYLQQKSVKMACASTKFQALSFCGSHEKPHGVRGLSKNYNL